MSILISIIVALSAPALAPQVHYTLRIDGADLRTVAVTMQIAGAPDSFTVAAHAHPEYDDKYWRYLEGMTAAGGRVVRRDSVLWTITGAGNTVTLHYRVRLPETQTPRAAWRSYLTTTGGLIGGPHSFLYVLGAEHAPVTVTLALPRGWTAASALTGNAPRYQAADVFMLMESPILVGTLREWQFRVKGVPHHVFYLPGAQPVAFDSAAFIDGIRRIVEQSSAVFARIPYARYHFLVADDAYGGLEHPNSVTLGARSAQLAENPQAVAEEIGHEFFHTWNLMSIKPAEYRGVDYRVQPPVPSLWFAEGFTIFYADLMMRRAGFIMGEPTRMAHLQQLLGRYMADPAYERFSAEAISRVEYNSPPGALGNYDPSSHVVGEVIAQALDLLVRAATDGRRSLDDVMRSMEDRHTRTGYTGRDVERVVADVCGCPVTEFFDRHVRGSERMDMNRYLQPFALRMTVTRAPALTTGGEVERDFRIQAWQPTPQDTLRLHLWHAGSIWVRAGLNVNDRVVAVNGAALRTWPELRSIITGTPLGGTLSFDIVRDGTRMQIPVVMSGFERTRVVIDELPDPDVRQQRLRAQWLAGR